ncbi:MAG: hypothetical protein ABSG23_12485 [Terriglobales bacterium]
MPPSRQTRQVDGQPLKGHLIPAQALKLPPDLADVISDNHQGDRMHRRILGLVFACFCAGQLTLQAEDFKLFDREVAIHGFASQGFVYTSTNNWLTMNTNQGSAAFTDFGFNVSSSVTDKLRVGAQLYDRNLGQLGQYHPSLDWAVVDYRFRSWFGIRGGKVKTTLGLYTDTQDLDFLHAFALLPQSVYPADLRDATIAHVGGDVYGSLPLKHRLGGLAYTAYAGHRSDSIYNGYEYLASSYKLYYSSYGGLQYGGDIRWNTPLKGLLIGASRMNEDLTGKATFINPFNPGAGLLPESGHSKADWTNQFYGEHTAGNCGSIRSIAAFCTMSGMTAASHSCSTT